MPNAFSKRLAPMWRWLIRATRMPPVGRVDLGSLRRIEPVSRQWGFDRGGAVDRYYIERFLVEHAQDIQGRVLEIQNNRYTVTFGGDRVTRSDVLDVRTDNPEATIVADLTATEHVEGGLFDAVICTQTLHVIYDMPAAIRSLHRLLKPRGVLLATLPGISQISREDMDRHGDHWRVTTASARRLFEERFGEGRVAVRSYGNVLAAIAFLEGLAAEELSPAELDANDPDYQALIAVRAVKEGAP